MKNNHRSEKLDALLDQKVSIIFQDGTIEQGVLFWNDKAGVSPLYLNNRGYYLRLLTGSGYLGFKKSHVKEIRKYRS